MMTTADHLGRLMKSCLVQVRGSTFGSGFFAAPGHVVSCAHVAGRPGDPVKVFWEGGEFEGTIADASPAPEGGEIWPYPDLAIITLARPPDAHPCVWLDDRIPDGGTLLKAAGYSDKYRAVPERLTADFAYSSDQDLDGGLMLRLKRDEVPPGMSGGPVLNTRSGGVCAMVKATRMEDTDMGGLAVPVGALRRLAPAAYSRLIRAHDAFHGRDHGWASAADELAAASPARRGAIPRSEERAMFALMSGLPGAGNPKAAFAAVAGPLVPLPETPMHEHRDVVSELEAMARTVDDVPRGLRYAATLAGATHGAAGARLSERVHLIAGMLGLGDRLHTPLTPRRPGPPSSVMVRLRPSRRDHTRYHVGMWRYEGPAAITPAGPESPAGPLPEALALVRERLPEQLAILGRSGETTMVELIVPRDLMEEDFDSWKLWPRRAWSSLGRKHPVVLRDLERLEDEELHPDWKRRWNHFLRDSAGAPALVCNGDRLDHEVLEGWIESDPTLAALVLAGSPRHTSSGAALEVALAAGIPVIIWRRTDTLDCPRGDHPRCASGTGAPDALEPRARPVAGARADTGRDVCAAHDFHAELTGPAAREASTPWPERVRILRGEAVSARAPAHYAQGLVLLWDDPERRISDPPMRYAQERYQADG
ncbi:trypsin-like peptidase domain-containing protein [Sphaerisporangium sp. TRM90804]|uniref:VMAP-C domain-containing protein n=1 Tax=Sphaerisporangium sp. TRM90804 TaxID=3031113 RepID=UPI00244C9B93|nr:trypsin-like peptidase domain-containing protein [Sphaerisporangium sp. TRM90804]MDH2424030.1 trypsin-like peptidase domain-containing protein [Sphaerisporangium sp. TRM90804]